MSIMLLIRFQWSRPMMDDLGETCKLGLYINNAKTLVMNHVTVEGNEGEAFDFHNIDHLIVDGEEKGAVR